MSVEKVKEPPIDGDVEQTGRDLLEKLTEVADGVRSMRSQGKPANIKQQPLQTDQKAKTASAANRLIDRIKQI